MGGRRLLGPGEFGRSALKDEGGAGFPERGQRPGQVARLPEVARRAPRLAVVARRRRLAAGPAFGGW